MNTRIRPILFVEDNPMDVDLTCEALKELSVVNPIVVCRDGEEALRYMDTHHLRTDCQVPVFVLLDLRLPKVDGIDVLRQARNDAVWRQVPFVVLTTSRENKDIAAAYELGANSYIVKPVDSHAFAELMKNIKVYWLLINEQPFGAMRGDL